MQRLQPFLALADPDPRTCHQCGEGTLGVAFVHRPSQPPRLAFHCSACTLVADVE